MPSPLAERILALYQRVLASGEIDLELAHSEIELRWAEDVPAAETYRGHEGVLRALEEWLEAWDEFHMEPLEVVERGDQIVLLWRQWGTGKDSGALVEMDVGQVLTIRDGKIWRLHEYASHDEALAAAGLTEGREPAPDGG